MNKQEIGLLIKKKRREKQLSQKKLAALLNISDTAVSKWENGVNLPDIQNLEPLSKILDIPVQIFLDTPLSVHNSIDSPVNNELNDSNEHSTYHDSPADHHLATDEKVFNHNSSPADDTSAMLNDESAPVMKTPDTPETDTALPNTEFTGFRKILHLKSSQWQITASLFILFLLGSIVVIYSVHANNSTEPSFIITEERYDDYEGEKAFYLIVEYTGKPTNQNVLEHTESLRRTYSSCFYECSAIVIAYFEEGNFHHEPNICESADYYAILYPAFSQ